jgi:uncharacterized protein YndB with AHSA1/START domain
VDARNRPGAMLADGDFVTARVVAAPRALVWQAYTEREHLMRWRWPKAFTMLDCTIDLRPSGVFHYGTRTSDGRVIGGKWIFREIFKPERLVVVALSDAAGGATRHPWAPEWPLAVLSTTTLAEHDGKTTIALQWMALNPARGGAHELRGRIHRIQGQRNLRSTRRLEMGLPHQPGAP